MITLQSMLSKLMEAHRTSNYIEYIITILAQKIYDILEGPRDMFSTPKMIKIVYAGPSYQWPI